MIIISFSYCSSSPFIEQARNKRGELLQNSMILTLRNFKRKLNGTAKVLTPWHLKLATFPSVVGRQWIQGHPGGNESIKRWQHYTLLRPFDGLFLTNHSKVKGTLLPNYEGNLYT